MKHFITSILLLLIWLITLPFSCTTEVDRLKPYGDATIDLGYCQINNMIEYNQMCKELGMDTVDLSNIPQQYVAQRNFLYEKGSTVHIHFCDPKTEVDFDWAVNHAISVYKEQEKKKNIKFRFTKGVLGDANSLIADRRFGFLNAGSYSFAGNINHIQELKTRINTNLGWFEVRTTRHESDHDMGRLHSQGNPKCGVRDTAFTLNRYKNSGWTEATIMAQVINQYNCDFYHCGECECDVLFYPTVKGEFKNGFTCTGKSEWNQTSDKAFDEFAYPFDDDNPIDLTPIEEDEGNDELVCQKIQDELDQALADIDQLEFEINECLEGVGLVVLQEELNQCITDRDKALQDLEKNQTVLSKLSGFKIKYTQQGAKLADAVEFIDEICEELGL